MGTKQDIVVHDLPAILERWRISKLASGYGSSKTLFKIMETPLIPSRQSSCSGCNALIEKTPERALRSRIPLNFTSYQGSITSQPADDSLTADLNENGILASFDALHINDEGILSDISEDVEASKEGDLGEELEGAIKKDQVASRLTSLGGECLSAFTQLLMVCQQSAPVKLSEVFSTYWLVPLSYIQLQIYYYISKHVGIFNIKLIYFKSFFLNINILVGII